MNLFNEIDIKVYKKVKYEENDLFFGSCYRPWNIKEPLP